MAPTLRLRVRFIQSTVHVREVGIRYRDGTVIYGGLMPTAWLTVDEATELTTVASGVQRQETTVTVPAGAVVLAAAVRVTIQPGGTTAMSVRSAASDHQFNADDVATDAASTDAGTFGCPFVMPTTESLAYVFDTPTTDALGRVRCAVLYYAITPPTS